VGGRAGLTALQQDLRQRDDEWRPVRRWLDQLMRWKIPLVAGTGFYHAFTQDASPWRLSPDALPLLLEQLQAFPSPADVPAFLAVAAEWAAVLPPPVPPAAPGVPSCRADSDPLSPLAPGPGLQRSDTGRAQRPDRVPVSGTVAHLLVLLGPAWEHV